MAKVKLPVSFRSLDPGDNEGDHYKKDITFYNIDYIMPNGKEDAETSIVSSGGEDFVCLLPIDELEKLIDKSK